MRLQKVISNLKPNIQKIGGYQIAVVSNQRALAQLDSTQTDGILVDNDVLLRAVLMDDDLYLTPLFCLGMTKRQCDGTVDDISDLSMSRKLDVLLPNIEVYQKLDLPEDRDKRILSKIVRYLDSRRLSLKATNERSAKIGYCFPLIEDMSIDNDPLHILRHLEDFALQGYFTKKIIDKVNICYDCHGSYLNFTECCTKCNAIDLSTEELVHHFRCAYVGPKSDFEKENKLICPKCDHQLKHIGIDYDKPSEIHTCRSCNHRSQETKMKAKCVDCLKENELDQLVTHAISDYAITEKAKTLAIEASSNNSLEHKVISPSTNLTSLGAYNLIKSHESRKPRRLQLESHNMVISLEPELLAQLNKGMQLALLEELAGIIKTYLGHNDLLTIDDSNNIHALLIDYEVDLLNELKDVLHFNLNKMLADNGWAQSDTVFITSESIRS